MHDRYNLQIFLVQVLSFDIIVIRIYDNRGQLNMSVNMSNTLNTESTVVLITQTGFQTNNTLLYNVLYIRYYNSDI